MNRRRFCLGGLSSLLLSSLPAWLKQAPVNIVLVTADDLGYGSLGCYGQVDIQTPNLDALASRGLRFAQAYSSSCVCAPSRWSLLTGRHVGQANSATNSELAWQEGQVTITEQLQGYQKACIGKWGLGYPAEGNAPTQRGFGYFYGYMTHAEAHNYYLDHLWENELPVFFPENQNGQKGLYIPDLLTTKALEFISQVQEPFFLYLAYNLPHINSGTGEFEVPTDAPYSDQPWSQDERSYAAMITRLDSYVGQILQALPANTIVIFTSDNGSDYPQMFRSNGDLRAGKSTLYEGGIRIPLIVSGPGITPALADGAKLFPSVCNDPAWLVNFPQVALSGDVSQFIQSEPMYWAFFGSELAEAVRVSNLKGIRSPAGFELYDLASDPGEQVNLAAAHPEITGQMAAIMDRYCPAPKECRVYLPVISK
jgi:arylsulfatase A